MFKMKTRTIRMSEIYPIMEVCNDCIAVSVGGAMTIGWELELPVAYTQTESEYDAMIMNLNAAIKGLDPWTVIHRQDLFLYDNYAMPAHLEGLRGNLLGRSYERHFTGRRFLRHRSYLFVTMGNRSLVEKEGKSSGLFGIHGLMPALTAEQLNSFFSKCDRFITTACSQQVGVRLLNRADWLGEGESVGIVQRYMTLGDESPMMVDPEMSRATYTYKDRVAQCFCISDADCLPSTLSSITRVNDLSTVHSNIYLSAGSPLGVLLDCEHAVNQIVIVPEQDLAKRSLEAEDKRMKAGLNSRDNALNSKDIDEFLNSSEINNDYVVRVHTDLIAWSSEEEAMKLNSRISAALNGMLNNTRGVCNRHNTPVIWYGTIPGCACELGVENSMTLPLLPSLLIGTYETFFKGLTGGMLSFSDRMSHVPVPMDFHRVAHDDYHLIDDYNMFVCGPTGSGKSFFTNYYARNCYDNGESVFIVDVGDSYEILCNVIREESGGSDGQYFRWDIDHPFSFNPFIGWKGWLDEYNNLRMDEPGVNFIMSFLQTVWEPADSWKPASTAILRKTLSDFIGFLLSKGLRHDGLPLLDDYYHFVSKDIAKQIREGRYRVGEILISSDRFDVEDYLLALKAYSLEGEFSFLMNNPTPADLFSSRFVVFEVDALSNVNDDKDRKFYSLCILCIMNSFDRKMRSLSDTSHKNLIIEEAWKAIANETMAPYLRGLWKTSRKFSCTACVVTQEIDDMLSSEVIRETILRNSSIKVLLDQSRNTDKLPQIVSMLGLPEKDINLIHSINRSPMKGYYYKEAYISLMGKFSCVVANEVSPQEAVAYESAKAKKEPTLALAGQIGWCAAVEQIAQEKKQQEYHEYQYQ